MSNPTGEAICNYYRHEEENRTQAGCSECAKLNPSRDAKLLALVDDWKRSARINAQVYSYDEMYGALTQGRSDAYQECAEDLSAILKEGA